MAACMAVLGGAWTPSVIWKLAGDPRRFGELQKDIPGISPKMLTARVGTKLKESTPAVPAGAKHRA